MLALEECDTSDVQHHLIGAPEFQGQSSWVEICAPRDGPSCVRVQAMKRRSLVAQPYGQPPQHVAFAGSQAGWFGRRWRLSRYGRLGDDRLLRERHGLLQRERAAFGPGGVEGGAGRCERGAQPIAGDVEDDAVLRLPLQDRQAVDRPQQRHTERPTRDLRAKRFLSRVRLTLYTSLQAYFATTMVTCPS